MNRSDYLCINSEDSFEPMSIASFVFYKTILCPTPYSVFHTWMIILEVKFCIGITKADEQFVDVVLILQNIKVTSYTSIQAFALGRYLFAYIFIYILFMLCVASSEFKRREILSFQILSEECLILPIIRHLPLDCPEKIHTSHRTLEKSRCVFGNLNPFLS